MDLFVPEKKLSPLHHEILRILDYQNGPTHSFDVPNGAGLLGPEPVFTSLNFNAQMVPERG